MNKMKYGFVSGMCPLIGLVCCLLLGACQSDSSSKGRTEALAQQGENKDAQFHRLPPNVAAATLVLKEKFDAGLRNYVGPERELAYLYAQNARLLRSHFLAEETFSFVFPFNGEMTLGALADLIEQLPYFTKNCGFQGEHTTVNYYCPAPDTVFFNYLATVSPPSSIIQQFHESYLEKRTITPQIRQQMLLSGAEELDFNSPDHQLFYALFQLWVSEEMQAYNRIRREGL